MKLTIIHTSDWHLGRSLYGQSRLDEMRAFFAFLQQEIIANNADALLVAGDIFDSTTPSYRAQELYYQCLAQLAKTGCQVVIIGGNHDSPALLAAPELLLKNMHIFVVGEATKGASDDLLIPLYNRQGQISAIVGAVPYLRERDVRQMALDDDLIAHQHRVLHGISEIYQQIAQKAHDYVANLPHRIPIIGMGHLLTLGGVYHDSDGVRELYIGSLSALDSADFAQGFDYMALGHLHRPQWIGEGQKIRYSGAPLSMSFGDQEQKSITVVQFDDQDCQPQSHCVAIPVTQALRRIEGSEAEVMAALAALPNESQPQWLEIIITETLVDHAALRRQIDALHQDSQHRVLRYAQKQQPVQQLQAATTQVALADLNVYDVFEHCLEAHAIDANEREALRQAYAVIVKRVLEDDPLAKD